MQNDNAWITILKNYLSQNIFILLLFVCIPWSQIDKILGSVLFTKGNTVCVHYFYV